MDELKSTDAKVLIKKFFDPKKKLYHGIEMIMKASVKMSCESVLESLVSIYKNYFDARRNMNEENTSEALNGPNLAHSTSIIKEAMDSYWKPKGSPWHFFRTSLWRRLNNIKEVRMFKFPWFWMLYLGQTLIENSRFNEHRI